MDTNTILDVFRTLINMAIRIAGPMLLICMLVGVVVALLQAVTQIHEQSIAFVLKLLVVVLFISLGGSWILTQLQDFSIGLFEYML